MRLVNNSIGFVRADRRAGVVADLYGNQQKRLLWVLFKIDYHHSL